LRATLKSIVQASCGVVHFLWELGKRPGGVLDCVLAGRKALREHDLSSFVGHRLSASKYLGLGGRGLLCLEIKIIMEGEVLKPILDLIY